MAELERDLRAARASLAREEVDVGDLRPVLAALRKELTAADADARKWPAKKATLLARLEALPLLLEETKGDDDDENENENENENGAKAQVEELKAELAALEHDTKTWPAAARRCSRSSRPCPRKSPPPRPRPLH